MKKILFFITTLTGGGAEKVLVNLVNNLDKNKFNITVMTLFDVGVNKQYLSQEIEYKSIFKKVFRGHTRILKLFPPTFLYKGFIKEEYDIVVAYLEGVPTRIVSGCSNNTTKKISWLHIEVENQKKFFRAYINLKEGKKCYEQYDKIVGVSGTAVESLKNIIGMSEKMCIRYNTVETQEILSKAKEEMLEIQYDKEKINLITTGRLVQQKGYKRLLEIHKKIIGEGIQHHLYILGEGKQRDELEQYIQENELGETVTLLGYKDNPYKYVKNADLFVCSSYAEGFSTAVTEALIVGTPVITTLCSGMEEMLDGGKYGLIVDNDKDALYQGLKTLLSDKKQLEYYKIQAKERGKFFNTKVVTDKVEQLFEQLLDG